MSKIVAFIPARSGSKRIQNKNIRLLNGHPLLAYSIITAIESQIFDKVICATDDEEYAEIARYYGAEVPILRPKEISNDKSSDFEWVNWLLSYLLNQGLSYEYFSILRPTSPFRTSETIIRAWEQFKLSGADSIRAVEICKQHPGKMWVLNEDRIYPLLPFKINEQPWHSTQFAALPQIFVQNASLEIASVEAVLKYKNISGYSVSPFITQGEEGFDINDEFDWWKAEKLLESNDVKLPFINKNI